MPKTSFAHFPERPLHSLKRPQHEHGHEPEHHDADEGGQKQEEAHVADNVFPQGLILLLQRNDDADGAPDGVQRPALLGKAGDIDLPGRFAMALKAALVYPERLHIAELRGAVVGRSLGAVDLGRVVAHNAEELLSVLLLVEQGQRLGFEGIGLVLSPARLEVRVADGVVVARREDGADALADDGAVQPLELVDARRCVVDGVLGVVHELPHGVHLAREGARLLGERVLHVLGLHADVEEREHRGGHHEHEGEHEQRYHSQADIAYPHGHPLAPTRFSKFPW